MDIASLYFTLPGNCAVFLPIHCMLILEFKFLRVITFQARGFLKTLSVRITHKNLMVLAE